MYLFVWFRIFPFICKNGENAQLSAICHDSVIVVSGERKKARRLRVMSRCRQTTIPLIKRLLRCRSQWCQQKLKVMTTRIAPIVQVLLLFFAGDARGGPSLCLDKRETVLHSLYSISIVLFAQHNETMIEGKTGLLLLETISTLCSHGWQPCKCLKSFYGFLC